MMKSVMQKNFAQVPAPNIRRSVFNRSHGVKGTMEADYLVPMLVDEILPGDTFTIDTTIFARVGTMLVPIMDNLWLDTFYFFVPNRLLWSNWEKFNGAQANPGDSIDYLIPTVNMSDGTWEECKLADYMGLRPNIAFGTPGNVPINALPFRAYFLIWNEWFRDENLQNSFAVPTGNGPDPIADYQEMKKRGKRYDYFTACLPSPQKGASVTLPLGTSAPVKGDGQAMGFYGRQGTLDAYLNYTDDTGFNGLLGISTTVGNAGAAAVRSADSSDRYLGLHTDATKSHVFADLTAATAATINQLRQAFAYQSVLERDARGGTRYVEFLLSHFGVISPDFRLQRPEYLGGSSQRIHVSAVPQSSATGATGTPQGNLAAYGVVASNAHIHKSFVEHGYLIGIMNVRADLNYQQNMRKMWTRRTRFDFYLPALANMGEQAVDLNEIYANGQALGTVFGYQERWAEYRFHPSYVVGKMRSQATGTLAVYHLAENYASAPALNATWIQSNTDMDRITAIDSEPPIIYDIRHEMNCVRPMPVFSIPANLARF